MKLLQLCGLIAFIFASMTSPAASISVEDGRIGAGHKAQGQLFYSETVSRVTNGTAQACMVSTGSDWRETGQARAALDVSRALADGRSIDEAFASTKPIDLKGLASNTPYMAFVIGEDGTSFLRFAAGFRMAPDSVVVSYGAIAERPGNFVIENRGDTGTFRDDISVQSMLTAFLSGESFTMTARSVKVAGSAEEHYIQYQFQGRQDQPDLNRCLADLRNNSDALAAHKSAKFSVSPLRHGDARTRITARAMACNRDLDPEETEVMVLDGEISGFASPLAYALVKRDTTGDITDIWSGDLWRLSKQGDGFALAFSNSISRQGPLDAQDHKACTGFGSATPVSLSQDRDGVIEIAPQFDAVLSSITHLPSAAHVPQYGPALRTSSSGFASQSGGFGNGSAITTASLSATAAAANLAESQSVSQIVEKSARKTVTTISQVAELNAVPIPATGLLLGCALLGLGTMRSRHSKQQYSDKR